MELAAASLRWSRGERYDIQVVGCHHGATAVQAELEEMVRRREEQEQGGGEGRLQQLSSPQFRRWPCCT